MAKNETVGKNRIVECKKSGDKKTVERTRYCLFDVVYKKPWKKFKHCSILTLLGILSAIFKAIKPAPLQKIFTGCIPSIVKKPPNACINNVQSIYQH